MLLFRRTRLHDADGTCDARPPRLSLGLQLYPAMLSERHHVGHSHPAKRGASRAPVMQQVWLRPRWTFWVLVSLTHQRLGGSPETEHPGTQSGPARRHLPAEDPKEGQGCHHLSLGRNGSPQAPCSLGRPAPTTAGAALRGGKALRHVLHLEQQAGRGPARRGCTCQGFHLACLTPAPQAPPETACPAPLLISSVGSERTGPQAA